MVASIAASAFLPAASVSTVFSVKASSEGSDSLGFWGIVAKPSSSPPATEDKAQARTVPKVNETKIGLKSEAHKAIQCLGSNCYVNEYPTGRLLRDAKLYEIGAGTSEIRRMIIGRELFNKG